MTFKEHLAAVCSALPETFVVTLLDHDGISVDTVSSHATDIDIGAYFVELTGVFSAAMRSSEQMQTGAVSELVVKTDRVAAVLRPVGPEYFLALALPPNGNTGKARYLMRVVGPKLLQELGA
jgi:predicted regulator of Ras-like GTPase activity (Roadblock/LC7/MglB family)